MAKFQVDLVKEIDDSYEIEIGYDLWQQLISDLDAGVAGGFKKIAVISDEDVAELYAGDLCSRLNTFGYEAELFTFPSGETYKTRETKAMIEDAMLEAGYRRDCTILAVGGGVVTDLAGFLAGTYGRGVPFINYATTLLAAADASVGGKTAVDTPLATNLIGLFNQPKKVYIDLETWRTLPSREIASGMAETIKHAAMADAEFFDFLEIYMDNLLALEEKPCEYMAEMNCRIKYSVVMRDERESGLREVLNLGHTVGRAIETVSNYRLLHGEAVSIGLVAQARLSRHLGFLNDEDVMRLEVLLVRAGLPTRIPDFVDRGELLKKLYTDKKVRDGKIRFVLQNSIGSVVCFDENVYATPVEEETVRTVLETM